MRINLHLRNHHRRANGRIHEGISGHRKSDVTSNVKGETKAVITLASYSYNCECMHSKLQGPLHCNPTHIPPTLWSCAINDVALSQVRPKLFCFGKIK